MDTILNVVGNAANFFGFFGGIFALLAWIQIKAGAKRAAAEAARLDERVRLVLQLVGQSRRLEVPLVLRRRNIARAELLGILGMVPMKEKGKRYSLTYFGTLEFLDAVDRLQMGTETELRVPCSQEEIEQFDLR
jgi:hypothetical protein